MFGTLKLEKFLCTQFSMVEDRKETTDQGNLSIDKCMVSKVVQGFINSKKVIFSHI